MPFRKKTVNATAVLMEISFVRVFTGLFLAAGALVLVQLWRPMPLPGKPGWPEAVLLLLAAISTISALMLHRPGQNVLLAAACVGLAGGAADYLDAKTGIPFGMATRNEGSGLELFGTLPWALSLFWIVAVLNSRGVARLILRPRRKLHRYGFWLIGVTAVLTVLFDVAFDPFASRVKQYWLWEPVKLHLSWQGAPLVNFFGWGVVALLIMAFVTPLLVNKRPRQKQPPDYHPLVMWLSGILLFGAGSASLGLWPAVALDAIIGGAVAVLAIRGAQW
jgi:uncharacterized membrane protein